MSWHKEIFDVIDCQRELVREEKGNEILSISTPPDGGGENSLYVKLVVSCEVEYAFFIFPSSLVDHVVHPALSGGNNQPAPAAVTETFGVGLAFEVGKPWQNLLAQEAGIVLRTTVDLQQIAKAVSTRCQCEKTVRPYLTLHLEFV